MRGWLLLGLGLLWAAPSDLPVEACLIEAIEARRVLAFTYHDAPRTVQPHRLGTSATGKTLLRAYELTKAGTPSNQWKLYNLAKISGLSPTGETFPAPAPGYTPADKALPTVRAEVPYTEEENKKEAK